MSPNHMLLKWVVVKTFAHVIRLRLLDNIGLCLSCDSHCLLFLSIMKLIQAFGFDFLQQFIAEYTNGLLAPPEFRVRDRCVHGATAQTPTIPFFEKKYVQNVVFSFRITLLS